MDYLAYLYDVDAQKQINKLSKKYKNKKIILYGAGEYFDIINDNYDLSALNIIGISDYRFKKQKNSNITNYNEYSPDELITLDFDVILITVFEELGVIVYLQNLLSKSKNRHKKISALIKPTIRFFTKTIFHKKTVLGRI